MKNPIQLKRFDDGDPSYNLGELRTKDVTFPLTELEYHTKIRTLGVATEITQTFYNPYDEALEATYIFPLEGTSAVVECIMLVDDRVVHAELQERTLARRRYSEALTRGHRAALLEENQSETFSLSVGNIPPGAGVRIRIKTVSQLHVVNSIWTLRLPLVVAPRYGSSCHGISVGTSNSSDTTTVMPPPFEAGSNPVQPTRLKLSVDIELGELQPSVDWKDDLSASLHTVLLESSEQSCRVSLPPGESIDRDFILRGTLNAHDVAIASRLQPPTQHLRGTFAIEIVAPENIGPSQSSRDIVFLLDRSGSMAGWKFGAAQRGVCRLIDSLSEKDRFVAAMFSCNTEAIADGELQHASDQQRFAATKWISSASPTGGTEMAKALSFALGALGNTPSRKSNLRPSIVLITDGHITGEDRVLAQLNKLPEHSRPRIYTIGIDRAANGSVLRRLSQATGGAFELAETQSQLSTVIERLQFEIGTPVLSNMRLENSDPDSDIAFTNTELYPNRPVSVFGRTIQDELNFTLVGTTSDGSNWSREIQVNKTQTDQSDLLHLWGRNRVRNLEDQYAINATDNESLRYKIVATSLESRVLSRFTSYVAIDDFEVVRSKGKIRMTLPVALPEGWSSLPFIPSKHLKSRHIEKPSQIIKRPSDQSVAPSTPVPSASIGLNAIGPLLIQKKLISVSQLEDAKQLAVQKCDPTRELESLTQLGYVTENEISQVIADFAKVNFFDFSQHTIAESVIELMPEGVARECNVIPVAEESGTLVVAVTDPYDVDTLEKLRFILNRDVKMVIGTNSDILCNINKRYGMIEGESADSILQEFCDTHIDFTETIDDSSSRNLTSIANFTHTFDPNCIIVDEPDPTPFAAHAGRISLDAPSPDLQTSPSIVRLVKLIISEAIQMKATKIRIQVTSTITVEYLIADHWQTRDQIPKRKWDEIVSHFKMIAAQSKDKEDWSGTLHIESNNSKPANIEIKPKSILIEFDVAMAKN